MGNLGLVHVALWCALVACALVDKKVYCASCDVEVSEILRTLLNPQENDSLQVQALRRQLLHKLQDMDVADQEYEKIYKGYTSPTKWTEFSDEQKRNLESLARGGTWYKNPPLADDYKRSHYNLLGSPDLPLTTELLANQKRSIEALARNGELNHHQNNQDFRTMLGEFNDKRNVASLAKHFNYPRQTIGKRSISSVAKNGDLPNVYGKRNIQSLARDGLLGKKFTEFVEAPQDKRIHSIKTEQRRKRQADYFSNEAVYQMPVDYEDVLQDLEAAEQNIYPLEDKRFLGRLPQMGKPRTTAIPKSHRYH
ncbi:neuropeptide-like precursor 1 isoform X2 [Rhynchophorus ferrugineus]|uniref:Neuropeptide-like protein-1 n=1 Tax=Rhynchophorus ferrugineus TaxID=354439 RepID=A0A5Q0TWR1_RHYFE|nr:neuropeptide-like protein precursor-1 [Rhynchophorus ferrugineus]